MVNFVPAVAYQFCLTLPATFTQPGDYPLAEPCSSEKLSRPTEIALMGMVLLPTSFFVRVFLPGTRTVVNSKNFGRLKRVLKKVMGRV